MPEDRAPRYLGLVHGHDRKPKRRLFELLKAQGLQANQDVTFLADGGEEVRALTELVTPEAEHVLVWWFHIAMRLTVLERSMPAAWPTMTRRRGHVCGLRDDAKELQMDYPHLGKFARSAQEFSACIRSNAGSLIRLRRALPVRHSREHGQRGGQQAHRQVPADAVDPARRPPAVQTRTRALDGTLRPSFERWHPGLANDNPATARQAAAA
jgi:hypothetical protein